MSFTAKSSTGVSFGFSGHKEMAARLREQAAKLPETVMKALYMEAQIEMTEAKRRTPFEFGVLRASGFVMEPVRNGRSLSVTLAFGGAASEYAVIVHEDLSAFHPHGQAKYLESTLKESAPHMAARIAARMRLS